MKSIGSRRAYFSPRTSLIYDQRNTLLCPSRTRMQLVADIRKSSLATSFASFMAVALSIEQHAVAPLCISDQAALLVFYLRKRLPSLVDCIWNPACAMIWIRRLSKCLASDFDSNGKTRAFPLFHCGPFALCVFNRLKLVRLAHIIAGRVRH